MSKKYATPTLTLKGCAIESTKAIGGGMGDPIDPPNLEAWSVGALGFNL